MKITRTASTASIYFPIQFVEAFKALFPRARWNPTEKCWTVAIAAVDRLEEFAAEIGGAAAAMAAAEAAQDAQPLSAAERQMLMSSIAVVKEAAQAIEAKKRERLAAAAQDSASKIAVQSMLAGLIDVASLKAVASDMARNMSPSEKVKKMRFEEGRTKFKAARDALAEAGLECVAVSFLACANVNRPDRDAPSCMPAGAWETIRQIES